MHVWDHTVDNGKAEIDRVNTGAVPNLRISQFDHDSVSVTDLDHARVRAKLPVPIQHHQRGKKLELRRHVVNHPVVSVRGTIFVEILRSAVGVVVE